MQEKGDQKVKIPNKLDPACIDIDKFLAEAATNRDKLTEISPFILHKMDISKL